jgi:hypothetical protein
MSTQLVHQSPSPHLLSEYQNEISLEELLKLNSPQLKETFPFASTYLSLHRIDNCSQAIEGARIIARSPRQNGTIDIYDSSVEKLMTRLFNHYQTNFIFSVEEWVKILQLFEKVENLARLSRQLNNKKYIGLSLLFNSSDQGVHSDGYFEEDTLAMIWVPVGTSTLFPHQTNVESHHYNPFVGSTFITLKDRKELAAIDNNHFALHRWGQEGTPHTGPEYDGDTELRALVNVASFDKEIL